MQAWAIPELFAPHNISGGGLWANWVSKLWELSGGRGTPEALSTPTGGQKKLNRSSAKWTTGQRVSPSTFDLRPQQHTFYCSGVPV